jgi:putative flippase GtrA
MNWRKEGGRFLKFLAVGLIGFVIDFGTFNLLSAGLDWNPTVAQAISFSCAVTSNFLWNRFWVYPDSRTKPVGLQVLLFAGINIVGLVIRTPLFVVLTPIWAAFLVTLPFELPLDPLHMAHNLSLACAVIVVLVWNFVVNRLWTYNDVR